MDSSTAVDDELWEELNHQLSHQEQAWYDHTNNNNNANYSSSSRNANTNNNNYHTTTNRSRRPEEPATRPTVLRLDPWRRWYRQCHQELHQVQTVVSQAAAEAWNEHRGHRRNRQYHQHHQYHPPGNSNNDNHGAYANNNNRSIAQQQQQQQQQQQHRTTNHNHNYWDEFGIPNDFPLDINNNRGDNEEGNPSLYYDSQQQRHSDNNNNNKHGGGGGGDYIHLAPWQRRYNHRPEEEGWNNSNSNGIGHGRHISNLDLYFQSLYTYFYHRGWIPIVAKGIVELVTLFFTLALSVFLFSYVDWTALAQCTDEHSCAADFMESYIRKKQQPTTAAAWFPHWTMGTVAVWLYCALFFLYSLFAVASFLHTLQDALQAKWVYEERLGISSRKLWGGAVDWDRDVVAKLIALQQSGEYRVVIPNNNSNMHNNESPPPPPLASDRTNINTNENGVENRHSLASSEQPASTPPTQPTQVFDALYIANRIMRKENFMVALFNRGIFDFTVPYLSSMSSSSSSQKGGMVFYSSSLEWSIYFCALNFMFNHRYHVRPAFYLDPAALRRRFQLCGVAHIVLMPFLLFFVTIYFGLQNAYDWKSTKQYLGPREWSQAAKWKFREFNELPHLFERRLATSYEVAGSYVDLFGTNEFVAAFGRILVFISGSLAAVVFVFAAINDAILLHVKIGDWNLLWYAGMFGVLYSVGKAMIPNATAQPNSARNLYGEMDEALALVASHTHFYPDTWKGRGWEQSTYTIFSSMFKYKIKIFATEVVSLILAPYILCFSLANCAEPICEFVLSIRTEIPGAGEVCGYATFDFDSFGDERWQGGTFAPTYSPPMIGSLADSILETGNVQESTSRFPKPKARYGKMEQSFMSFKNSHPSWTGASLRQTASDAVDSMALTREVDLHRQAAARQLETLEKIEEGRLEEANGENDQQRLVRIDESHIPVSNTTQLNEDRNF